MAEHAGTAVYKIVWIVTDSGFPVATSSWTTTLTIEGAGPDSPETSGAVIVGYTTSGPGPITVSEGPRGIDATIGSWGGPLYPNGPCGEPVSFPVIPYDNRLIVEIDVGSGGRVSFDYDLSQTGTPALSEYMNIVLEHGAGTTPLLWQWGNPAFCWGNVWESPRIAMTVNLNPYVNQHAFLVFTVTGNLNFGTETQGRIHSIAINTCGETPIAPLSPADQAFEDSPNRWDESGLTPGTLAALNCFRSKVDSAGGVFDISEGSAYRTPGYQAHLQEVWDKYDRLRHRTAPECQQLKDSVQYEVETKHRLKTRPAGRGGPHPRGVAFDATVTGVDQDSLACACGLHRPYKVRSKKNKIYDPVHFEVLTGPCP